MYSPYFWTAREALEWFDRRADLLMRSGGADLIEYNTVQGTAIIDPYDVWYPEYYNVDFWH